MGYSPSGALLSNFQWRPLARSMLGDPFLCAFTRCAPHGHYPCSDVLHATAGSDLWGVRFVGTNIMCIHLTHVTAVYASEADA